MSKNKKKKLKKKAKRQAELLEKQIQQLEELEELPNNSDTHERIGDVETEVDGDGEAEPEGEGDADCEVESEGPSAVETEGAKMTAAEAAVGHHSLVKPTTSKTGSISICVLDTKTEEQDAVADVTPQLIGDKKVKPKSSECGSFNWAWISVGGIWRFFIFLPGDKNYSSCMHQSFMLNSCADCKEV